MMAHLTALLAIHARRYALIWGQPLHQRWSLCVARLGHAPSGPPFRGKSKRPWPTPRARARPGVVGVTGPALVIMKWERALLGHAPTRFVVLRLAACDLGRWSTLQVGEWW